MENSQLNMPVLNCGEVENILREALQRELKGWQDEGLLIRCCGSLMHLNARREINKGKWPKLLGLALESNGTLSFNAPYDLMADYADGDFIEIYGYPTINIFRGNITVQFEAINVRMAESHDEHTQRRETNQSMAKLTSLKPKRNPFPIRPTWDLDLIFTNGSLAQVDGDFKGSLSGLLNRLTINEIPIKITSPEAIVQAIQSSKAHLLVIIRGGGSAGEFQVFNNELVLNALSDKSSYRVVGLGHHGNTSMIDLIADYSATTPTQAGNHVKEQIENLSDLTDYFESELEDKQSEIDSLRDQFDRKVEEAEEKIQRVTQQLESRIEAPQPKENFWQWALIGMFIAIFLGLAASHPFIKVGAARIFELLTQ
ncbi:hypothetical protein LG331_09850 [Vreelandella aquamarina]|uniref:exodeoxyribonuclease VII large subunit n=1 Tax=Vreelandella aquamarina TaxID=77097 RepID=UPI00384D3191